MIFLNQDRMINFKESIVMVIIPLLLVLFYWMFWRWTHRRMLKLATMVPGPPALPVLGNALVFLVHPRENMKIINDLFNKYGDYVKFWLGPELNICVKDPTDVRFLLTSSKVNQKGPLYEFLTPFIGRGILSGGPNWRIYRKIVTPSYNKKTVEIFSSIFNREADNLTKILSSKDPHQTINVYYDVVHCTTQSVCQTLMGLSKEDSLNLRRLNELVLKTPSFYKLVFLKMTRWWLQIPVISWMAGIKVKENYFIKTIDELTSDIIEKRKNAMKSEVISDDAMGIVDRLILAGLDDNELRFEIFSLFTTSQEASAKIVSGVLLFLAHLPDWQEKVYTEIINTVGPKDDVTEDHLKDLNYLDMVYKEVLRYLSIAAMIQRTVKEEITINNGKITLPAKTSLVIPLQELHRDPRYWDEPNKVMPERFLPENAKTRNPNAFIPFSLGPMDCLGRVYATALIKILVVKVIRQLQLEADGKLEDLELDVAISVRFAEGYNLRVRKRHDDGRQS